MLAEFGDVGLMTGDVTINPSATCLVMTTEVGLNGFYGSKLVLINMIDFAVYAISWIRDYARGRLGDF